MRPTKTGGKFHSHITKVWSKLGISVKFSQGIILFNPIISCGCSLVAPAFWWSRCQLLGEIKINNVDNNVQQLTEQILGVVRKLNIQALQLDRIHNALLEIIQKALLIRSRAKKISPLLLRIWAEKDCVCGRGWGFFVVEQPYSHSQDMAGLTMYLVELFLYQE